MNPEALLALISDLYLQIKTLQLRVTELEQERDTLYKTAA